MQFTTCCFSDNIDGKNIHLAPIASQPQKNFIPDNLFDANSHGNILLFVSKL